MKVSHAPQVFSSSVASTVSLLSRTRATTVCGRRRMPQDGGNTALLLYFFDNLFDSINGGISGKKMRFLTETEVRTLQSRMWTRPIRIIQSMHFIKRSERGRAKPTVLRNWVLTLRGFQLLCQNLQELGFKNFATRAFNQNAVGFFLAK